MKTKWIVIRDNRVICEGADYWKVDSLAKSNKAVLAKRYQGRVVRLKDYSI